MKSEVESAVLLKFPLGMDVRSPEYELSEGCARALVNLDVARGGGLKSRFGLRSIEFGIRCHSPYTPPHGQHLLYARGSILRYHRSDGSSGDVATVAGPVVYADLDCLTYWTDGLNVGAVAADGTARRWGLPVPPQIRATAVLEGGLPAGCYQITQAAVVNGEESGAPYPVEVSVVEGGGIAVEVPLGATFAVYISPANGTAVEMRHALSLISGTTAIIGATALAMAGKPIDSLGAIPPVPGSVLAAFAGRLYTAVGQVLWFTSSRSPNWIDPEEGYLWFDEQLLLLAAAVDGLYVGTASRVWFLENTNPNNIVRRLVSDVGVIPGASLAAPASVFGISASGEVRVWLDVRGRLSVGMPGGQIVYPTEARYVAGSAYTASLAYRELNGLRQIVAWGRWTSSANVSVDVPVHSEYHYGIEL